MSTSGARRYDERVLSLSLSLSLSRAHTGGYKNRLSKRKSHIRIFIRTSRHNITAILRDEKLHSITNAQHRHIRLFQHAKHRAIHSRRSLRMHAIRPATEHYTRSSVIFSLRENTPELLLSFLARESVSRIHL